MWAPVFFKHTAVPAGFKVEGIDIELCLLSLDVQGKENVEKTPVWCSLMWFQDYPATTCLCLIC